MAVWTLVLHTPPRLTRAGSSGQIEVLTKASNRSLTFDVAGHHELTFSLPGRHPVTALVKKGQTDVLAYRDDDPPERFHVISRSISKSGPITATFRCVSYKALLTSRILFDKDVRSWVTPTGQSVVAWTLARQTQSKPHGHLGMVRGVFPDADLPVVLQGELPTASSPRREHFDAGSTVGEAIGLIAGLERGFDWDVRQHPTTINELTFDVWSPHRGRAQPTFLLDDGGNVAQFSTEESMAEFADVLRVNGQAPTGENVIAADGPVLYSPGLDPADDVGALYGRWERPREVDTSSATTLASAAPLVLREALAGADPSFTLTLAAGKWNGPEDLWLGDHTRVLARIATFYDAEEGGGEGEPLLDVDQVVRVNTIAIGLDDVGREAIVVQCGRRPVNLKSVSDTLRDRLRRLTRQ